MAKDDAKQQYDSEYALKMIEFSVESYFGEIKTATGTIVRTGRAKKYGTIEELQAVIEGYFAKLKEMALNGLSPIPDVEHFCGYAGISRDTYRSWMEPGVMSDDFREEVKRFDTLLAGQKKQLMFKNQIPAVPALADLNNNHGYTNQTTTVKHEYEKGLPSIEELKRKIPGLEKKTKK